MKNNYKLENIEIISIILLVMINKLILNVPYYIVNLTGSGSIVNIIYIGIIDFIFLLVIIKLLNKFGNLDLLDISEFLAGKRLKIVTAFLSISLFMLVSFITLIDFSNGYIFQNSIYFIDFSNVLHTIYFSNFDMTFILLVFIIGILIANLIGFKSIVRIATFIIPFAIISVIISFFSVFNSYDLEHLTPILGRNYYTTFGLGLTNTFAMYIIVYYYFLKPLLKNPEDFKKISIISYIISLAILLLTVTSMLTLFNTTTSSEPINSLFLLIRQIELGTFIQRVDSVFILLWILSIFTYLSFVVFIINRILKKILNVSNEKMLSFSTCSILFGLTLIPINVSKIHFIENTLYKYIILAFMFGFSFIILILASIKKLRSNK